MANQSSDSVTLSKTEGEALAWASLADVLTGVVMAFKQEENAGVIKLFKDQLEASAVYKDVNNCYKTKDYALGPLQIIKTICDNLKIGTSSPLPILTAVKDSLIHVKDFESKKKKWNNNNDTNYSNNDWKKPYDKNYNPYDKNYNPSKGYSSYGTIKNNRHHPHQWLTKFFLFLFYSNKTRNSFPKHFFQTKTSFFPKLGSYDGDNTGDSEVLGKVKSAWRRITALFDTLNAEQQAKILSSYKAAQLTRQTKRDTLRIARGICTFHIINGKCNNIGCTHDHPKVKNALKSSIMHLKAGKNIAHNNMEGKANHDHHTYEHSGSRDGGGLGRPRSRSRRRHNHRRGTSAPERNRNNRNNSSPAQRLQQQARRSARNDARSDVASDGASSSASSVA